MPRLRAFWWRELRYRIPPGCPPEEAREALERAIIYEFEQRKFQAEPAGNHGLTFWRGFTWPAELREDRRVPFQDFQSEIECDVAAVRLRYRVQDKFNWIRACSFPILLTVWGGLVPGGVVGVFLGAATLWGLRYYQLRTLAPIIAAAGRRVFPQEPPI